MVKVVVSEGAPDYGGHKMAKVLASSGINTTAIPDSAIFAMMARCNKVSDELNSRFEGWGRVGGWVALSSSGNGVVGQVLCISFNNACGTLAVLLSIKESFYMVLKLRELNSTSNGLLHGPVWQATKLLKELGFD